MWSPIDPVRLFVNASYVDSEITRGCCFQDTTDPTGAAPGAQVVDAASGAQTLVGNYAAELAGGEVHGRCELHLELHAGCVHAGGTYSFTDDLQSNVFSNPIARADSNEIADFRLLWNDAQNRYTIIGFVKNAFDEEGYIRSSGSAPTGSRLAPGRSA